MPRQSIGFRDRKAPKALKRTGRTADRRQVGGIAPVGSLGFGRGSHSLQTHRHQCFTALAPRGLRPPPRWNPSRLERSGKLEVRVGYVDADRVRCGDVGGLGPHDLGSHRRARGCVEAEASLVSVGRQQVLQLAIEPEAVRALACHGVDRHRSCDIRLEPRELGGNLFLIVLGRSTDDIASRRRGRSSSRPLLRRADPRPSRTGGQVDPAGVAPSRVGSTASRCRWRACARMWPRLSRSSRG